MVQHGGVCGGLVPDLPPGLGRFLGDTSGLAGWAAGRGLVFCRHSQCWQLQLDTPSPAWQNIAGLARERSQVSWVMFSFILVGVVGVQAAMVGAGERLHWGEVGPEEVEGEAAHPP